ncbi:MAG: TSUP family transporter [Rhodospirillales bacterium]|nr:TSUP family transporter [Rhodospirillales bacterium]
MELPVDLIAIIAGCAIILIGAIVQTATGIAAGILTVPVLFMIDPIFVPGPMLISSLSLISIMTWRGRARIEYRRLNIILVGAAIGAALAAAVLSAISADGFKLIFGVLLLVAVSASAWGHTIPVNKRSMFLAGITAAFMGTIAAIGGVVFGLLYQREIGPVMRATLAYLYLTVTTVMLGFMWLAGSLGWPEVKAGVVLLPGWILGYFLAERLSAFLDGGYLRVTILSFSGGSALFLIAQNL